MNTRNWLEGSGIDSVAIAQISATSALGKARAVKVALGGEYGLPYQHEAARVLRMAVSAALAWEHLPPVGLLIDLGNLRYFGGDTLLLAWDSLLEAHDDASRSAQCRLAFLCSPENRQRVQSLIDEAADERSVRTFLNEGEAMDFVLWSSPASK